jgi:ABC-type antimicrobial peptide transport system permease subunit
MALRPESFQRLFAFNIDTKQLSGLLLSLMNNTTNSLDYNLRLFGYADSAVPYSIDIYPNDFAAKQNILKILNSYNDQMSATGQDAKIISYTDMVGTLMNSITDIISKVASVLVAFVSISLVVSSIMIGVITYISVLERKKEIGILRAIGASKRDIGSVFTAETLIVGFVAGVFGVGFTWVLIAIFNPILRALLEMDAGARLPLSSGLGLIAISMFLTFAAGLIPSSAASRKDPVAALRSE